MDSTISITKSIIDICNHKINSYMQYYYSNLPYYINSPNYNEQIIFLKQMCQQYQLCLMGFDDFVNYLIKYKYDVNHKNLNGNTLMHILYDYDKIKYIVEEYPNKRADITILNNNKQTPLHTSKYYDAFKYLIDLYLQLGYDIYPLDFNDNLPWTFQKDHDVVKYLIELGADVNKRDYYSKTLLHSTSDEKILLLLLNNNAEYYDELNDLKLNCPEVFKDKLLLLIKWDKCIKIQKWWRRQLVKKILKHKTYYHDVNVEICLLPPMNNFIGGISYLISKENFEINQCSNN
jgi:ankyrin repeat protein